MAGEAVQWHFRGMSVPSRWTAGLRLAFQSLCACWEEGHRRPLSLQLAGVLNWKPNGLGCKDANSEFI